MAVLQNFSNRLLELGLALAAFVPGSPAFAQQQAPSGQATYADLADLSDNAEIVLRAQIRKQAELEPERSPGLKPGYVRLYVEARTGALLTGRAAVGESLSYLVDVPRDSQGRAPKLKKRNVLIFARTVAGRPGQIQLVTPYSQLLWDESLEARLRNVLAELVAPDAAPAVTGIREALSIAGNLAGESETQLFLTTKNDGPVSISVIRRPGQNAVWGVSWSEIVDQAARPPLANTLDWYRLACFLPARLPAGAYLSRDSASRRQADLDYRFVLEQLGPCPRNRS